MQNVKKYEPKENNLGMVGNVATGLLGTTALVLASSNEEHPIYLGARAIAFTALSAMTWNYVTGEKMTSTAVGTGVLAAVAGGTGRLALGLARPSGPTGRF